MTRTGRGRAWLVVVCLPMAGAAVACSAGELVYARESGGAPSEPGADAGNEGGAADGSLLTLPPQDDGGFLPAIRQLACNGLDAGCDPTAGMGCCLAASSGPSGSDNRCLEQVQHYNAAGCVNDGDVFLACLASTGDSTCCWQPEGAHRMNTRFRADCTGGIEACDPNADGGSCASGGACTQTTCRGVVVGYCGGGPAPCQP